MPHVVVNGTPLELPEAPSLADADALDAAGVVTRPVSFASAEEIWDEVRSACVYGDELPVRTSSAMRAGEPFATFHAAAKSLNSVTGPHVDPITSTPEYKVTAVRMEKV